MLFIQIAVSLVGIVLLILLQYFADSASILNPVKGQSINMNEATLASSTLARIVTFFKHYKRVNINGTECQSALAINVQMEQCQEFTPTDILTKEIPEEVKCAISKEDPVYQGEELIGAGVKKMGRYKIHSERLLLNPTAERPTPPMQKLLDTRKNSCTVFYTFNSPCARTCLNESSPYNILQGLQNWSEHASIKALVFKQIWRRDEKRKDVLEAALKKIVNRNISVYRCISETVCYACGGKDGPINDHCLSNQHLCTVSNYSIRDISQIWFFILAQALLHLFIAT